MSQQPDGRRPGSASAAMLPRLTSLRIFGALAVLVFHLGIWDVSPIPQVFYRLGYVGVAFFFVLSGFVLAWGTRPNLPARTFYRRRFARVWPSHFVMLLVAAIAPVVSIDRGWFIAIPNLLLVQSWFVGQESIIFGMNGVSWSLSCEAFFYAVFPLTVLLLRRYPRWVGWAVSALGLVLALAVTAAIGLAALYLPIVRFSEFVLGVVAGLAVRDGWQPRVGMPVATLALALSLTISFMIPPPFPNTVMAPAFLLVLLCAADRDLQDCRGWLRSRWLVLAGEASFAFYLVHELLIVNLLGHLTGDGLLDALIILLAATACAVVLHLAVERPCNRLLRNRALSIALQALPPGHGEEDLHRENRPRGAPEGSNGSSGSEGPVSNPRTS